MKEDFTKFLPLSPLTCISCSFSLGEDRHGYGIMQEVARQSDGQYKLGPGTLCDNLQRLMNQGVVDEVSPRSADEDPRRRYYRLTAQGRGILSAEVTRLEGVVREAKLHLQPSKPRRA